MYIKYIKIIYIYKKIYIYIKENAYLLYLSNGLPKNTHFMPPLKLTQIKNMAHHFILLRLNPFGLRVDRKGWWFEHSMS